ncbi:DEAD/DEAH box helicase [Shewanella algicola]|uniref:DEAD/DEAH box helicase n=1 Tax=Shewanella algicola TaxID=640633 RepID=A0A9X2CFK5_9GAMM|nr:DEAD/DEAH box helicase [Shewanella algicola]MCL1107487.1 DEAD/DEAH box helicase [Shewanella algicola]GGP69373.1 DEAD/DEAH box helicase [Shewanella algicola]
MLFSQFSLSATLLKALPASITEPSRIQQLAIPAILNGQDVLALAQTGSGKTYAYGLPILQRISQTSVLSLAAIVIVPTRELAQQVAQNLQPLAQSLGLHVEHACGGEAIECQIERLTTPANILVATPGRLLALAQQGVVTFSQVQSVVLDEADRLLDMGFINDINALIAMMPVGQRLLFSATMPVALNSLAQLILSANHVRIEAQGLNSAVDDIVQMVYHVNKGSKAQALIHLVQANQWQQVLVFVNAKADADALCKKLLKAGVRGGALHGDKEQAMRSQTLEQFKSGQLNVLVATDVLARGIHIDALPVVINFDLPTQAAVYVHRIGRTARAGLTGVALSLVSHSEMAYLEAINTLTTQALPVNELVGFAVTDKPLSGSSKRAPRDKQANRRTMNKRSSSDFAKRKSTR